MTLLEKAAKAVNLLLDIDTQPKKGTVPKATTAKSSTAPKATSNYPYTSYGSKVKKPYDYTGKRNSKGPKLNVIDPADYRYTPSGMLKRNMANVFYVKSKPKEPLLAKNQYVGNPIGFSQIGSFHIRERLNNQDSFVNTGKLKIVVDGCGGQPYSEVGARLFTQLIKEEEQYINENNFVSIVSEIFERMTVIFNTDELVDNNLLFTIIACIETKDSYHVFCCGDGYIITYNGKHVNFIEISNGRYPHYYAYNYIKDKSSLGEYAKGMKFQACTFPKSEYENIGVATDGLRFFFDLRDESQLYLLRALKNGNDDFVSRIIRSESSTFADDVTISM